MDYGTTTAIAGGLSGIANGMQLGMQMRSQKNTEEERKRMEEERRLARERQAKMDQHGLDREAVTDKWHDEATGLAQEALDYTKGRNAVIDTQNAALHAQKIEAGNLDIASKTSEVKRQQSTDEIAAEGRGLLALAEGRPMDPADRAVLRKVYPGFWDATIVRAGDPNSVEDDMLVIHRQLYEPQAALGGKMAQGGKQPPPKLVAQPNIEIPVDQYRKSFEKRMRESIGRQSGAGTYDDQKAPATRNLPDGTVVEWDGPTRSWVPIEGQTGPGGGKPDPVQQEAAKQYNAAQAEQRQTMVGTESANSDLAYASKLLKVAQAKAAVKLSRAERKAADAEVARLVEEVQRLAGLTKDSATTLNRSTANVQSWRESAGGSGLATGPATAPTQQQGKPPMEGAMLAPDGKWYIQQDGKFHEVIP